LLFGDFAIQVCSYRVESDLFFHRVFNSVNHCRRAFCQAHQTGKIFKKGFGLILTKILRHLIVCIYSFEAEDIGIAEIIHLFFRLLEGVQPPQIILETEVIKEYRQYYARCPYQHNECGRIADVQEVLVKDACKCHCNDLHTVNKQ
jgi:hypothetical protein